MKRAYFFNVSMLSILSISCCLIIFSVHGQEGRALKIAKMRYSGGGDWYANKTALPNLIRFTNQNLHTFISPQEDIIAVGDANIINYPYVYMTGHGSVVFSAQEVDNLRTYLLAGGFLHIDDNYGLDAFIRIEMKKVFPSLDFVDIPFSHPIYKQHYAFPKGLPKIHQHDGKSPQGLGLFYQGRLLCFYSYESDLGNGWEDADIHNDPQNIRKQALQMGANILSYVFTAL